MEPATNSCEAEYAKDLKIKKKDIKLLEEWAEKLQHMPKITEFMLIQIYHASDYSLQRAKMLAEIYYGYKSFAPELFDMDEYPEHQCTCDYWEASYYLYLPKKTAEGYRLCYVAFRNPALFTGNEFCLKMHLRNLISVMMTEGICPGYVLIYDLKHYGLQQMADLNINFAKKFVNFSQDAIPIKVKKVYIINGYSIIDKLVRLIKPFVNKEIHDMLCVRSNIDEFFKEVPRDYLPRDIGGTLPYTREELNEQMRNRANSIRHLVDEEMRRKTNESNRIGEKTDDFFDDSSASFRKLEID